MPHNDGEPAETRTGRLREKAHAFRERREEKQRQRQQAKAEKQRDKRDRRREYRAAGDDIKAGVKASRVGSVAGTLVSGARRVRDAASSAASRAGEVAANTNPDFGGMDERPSMGFSEQPQQSRGFGGTEQVALGRADVDGDGEIEDVLARLNGDGEPRGPTSFLDVDGDSDPDVVLSGFGGGGGEPDRGGAGGDPLDPDPFAGTLLDSGGGGGRRGRDRGSPFPSDDELDDIFGGL
jgi:hypothetical protein